jgi:hypothetical protein
VDSFDGMVGVGGWCRVGGLTCSFAFPQYLYVSELGLRYSLKICDL